MARAARPRPEDRVAPPARSTLEERYAAAQRAERAAADHVAQVSAQALAKLLRGGPEARFAALADPASCLTPEHRGQLLASLRGQAAPARPISAATASWWAIWRSRLPYRVVPLALRGIGAAALIGLGLLAWHRTPAGWVTITGRQALLAPWQLPDGSRSETTLTPGQHYPLVRWEGEVGILRLWLPGRGYAETRVGRAYLQDGR